MKEMNWISMKTLQIVQYTVINKERKRKSESDSNRKKDREREEKDCHREKKGQKNEKVERLF